MKKRIKEAVNNRMPDKESIRARSMTDHKKTYIGKPLMVTAAVILVICMISAAAVMLTTGNKEGTEITGDNSYSPLIEEMDDGIYLPKEEIVLSENCATMDVIGFVVYEGRVYTQAQYLYCDEADREKYKGTFLGTARNNYGCFEHDENDLTEDFTSSVSGDVYTVNGYDPDFRICIPEMYEGCDFIAFFECLNGITVKTGEDLYGEQRLDIGEYEKVYVYDSEYRDRTDDDSDAEATYPDSEYSDRTELDPDEMSLVPDFVENLMTSSFVNFEEKIKFEDSVSLYFELEDGTSVGIMLLPGGYVRYINMIEPVMVKIEDEIFNELYNMMK